jgi:precorrin-2 methylase
MKAERIGTKLDRVREQIAVLQSKERELSEQKQMAEDAETMKMIKKYRISPEKLQMMNSLSEDEVKGILAKRETEQQGGLI